MGQGGGWARSEHRNPKLGGTHRDGWTATVEGSVTPLWLLLAEGVGEQRWEVCHEMSVLPCHVGQDIPLPKFLEKYSPGECRCAPGLPV